MNIILLGFIEIIAPYTTATEESIVFKLPLTKASRVHVVPLGSIDLLRLLKCT